MTKIREPLSNPNRETFALAQLLWKSELIDLLTKIDAIKGLKYKPKFKLWREVSSRMEFEQLEPIVINYLRQRDNWENPLKVVKEKKTSCGKKTARTNKIPGVNVL